jgi:sulfide:quinone oxidoreductase
LYKRNDIGYKKAQVISFHPEGDPSEAKPYVLVEYVFTERKGIREKLPYDFLINETGLKLAFYMTEGLITGTNITFSACTYYHASHASTGPHDLIREIKTTN